MKILHFAEDFLPGGISKHITDIANYSLRTEFKMYVAASPSRYRSKLDPRVPFIPLSLTKEDLFTKNYSGIPSSLWSLFQVIREEKIDVMHTHKRYAHFFGKFISSYFRIPHITSFHTDFEGKKRLTYYGNYSLCCSSAVFELMKNRYGAKDSLQIVPYGIWPFREYSEQEKIQTRKILQIPLRNSVISSIGQFIPVKNKETIIFAISELRKRRDIENITFLFLGHGPQKEQLQLLVKELRIEPFVKFVDGMFNVEAVMNISEFLILNSLKEAFGIVLLEAASIGKIHIGSRVGGIPEFIEDGETGLLIEKSNVAQLVDAMEYLIDHPVERSVMELKARRKYEHSFQFERMFSQLTDVYKTVYHK
jgi:L-malate glycosyltransferase